MAPFSASLCLLSGPAIHSNDRAESQLPALSDRTPSLVYPASKSQEGIFTEYLNDPLSSKYNLSLEIDLPKDDLATIFERTTQGKPYIKEYAPTETELDIGLILGQGSEIKESTIKNALRRPFSLTTEYPVRWHIVKDAFITRLYLAGHHIALDGLALTELSKEFLTFLNDNEAKLPSPENFSQMHMIEHAWSNSPAYRACQKVMLDQVVHQSHAPWPKTPNKLEGQERIDDDLEKWSTLYKTSWFRVFTSLIGLLVADETKTPFGREEVLSVGYGSRPEALKRCVGQFANALPVKLPLWGVLKRGESSLAALVRAMSKNISAVKKAELFSVTETIRAARKANIDCEAPRVAVTIIPKLAAAGCRVFPVEGRWDLYFCFQELQDGVTLGVIYDPQLFTASSLNMMKTKFRGICNTSVRDGVKLQDILGWLPQHPSLPTFPTTRPSNPCRHAHHHFDAHAETSPNSLALFSAELGLSLTYGQLYASTEHKAGFLRSRNISPGAIVIISIGRGFAVIEWTLAILKCGAAFTYLDPELAESAKANVLSVCEAELTIDKSFIAEMPGLTLEESHTEQDEDLSILEKTKYGTSDDDLMYVIFTSGSTGTPKGVMLEHGNLAHYLQSSTKAFDCGYGSRILQLASFAFDASILEWMAALCTGGCLCFAEHPQQLVGDYLADVIDKNQVSFIQITPSNLDTLPIDRELPSLQQVSIGGEAGSRSLFSQWHSRVDLVNAYGPTEAAIAVCFNRIDKSDQLTDTIAVGRPNVGTEVSICTFGFGTILAPGSPGEICIAGPQVARGYLRRPEAQSKQFMTHSNGSPMYRTGDQGMMLEDGSVVVMGRLDRELKVRGFRIAPEEIEMAILKLENGITEASVHASESNSGLIAFVAPSDPSPKIIRDALRGQLPDYKIPSSFIGLRSLPKNVSGKVDHKAIKAQVRDLRTPPPTEPSIDMNSTVPDVVATSSDDIEHKISVLWAEVIGLSEPPRSDVNFFDLGGHSLLVSKLYVKLKKAFPDIVIRLPQLFRMSTIQMQAQLYSKSVARTRRLTVEKPTRASKSDAPISTNGDLTLTRTSANGNGSLDSNYSPLTHHVEHTTDRSMAIIGMAGRFPGAANVDDFYDRLREGYLAIVDSGVKVKHDILPNNVWVPRAGFLSDVEDFDPGFWHLTKEAATEMDPQQRLFMEVAYEALVDAGIDLKMDHQLGTRVGLFVGAANPAYHNHTHSVVTDNFLRQNRGFVMPSISALTAYHLNMSGPNITIQNNCASSTVALSLAVDSIRAGRCDLAVVGGISVQLFEGGYTTYNGIENGQIFSPRGVCSPFDSSADGTVPADAVVAVILSRHSTALAQQTPYYAEILGTGIGSDGALEKVGFQVPSPRGQAEVMKKAWRDSHAEISKLRYTEIHGSGTPIGDALELEGLALATKELGKPEEPRFVVGSTKGNIGNSQHASGLVSLVKICKSIQHGIIPATRGLTKPNSMIDPTLPIHFATEETKLTAGDLIGVSATGWGGVNSHMVLAPPADQLRKTQTRRLPHGFFKRQRLQAPRLRVDGVVVDTEGHHETHAPQINGQSENGDENAPKVNGHS
nr:hybrid pks-nrps synthetase tas1 [Quercus suber]